MTANHNNILLTGEVVLQNTSNTPECRDCGSTQNITTIHPLPNQSVTRSPLIRHFESGATRDSDDGKYDYEGCFSPLVLERFGEYMYSHSIQSDGSKRPSDNWQKGIPMAQYMKSLWRHVMDAWKIHRGIPVIDKKKNVPVTMEEALCAIMFNVMGYLHEYLKRPTSE